MVRSKKAKSFWHDAWVDDPSSEQEHAGDVVSDHVEERPVGPHLGQEALGDNLKRWPDW